MPDRKNRISFEDLLPGETPIDDASGLRVVGITTRKQLSLHEAQNIRKTLTRYFANELTPTIAPFTSSWALSLHDEMFGEVWDWAGQIRTSNTNIGIPFYLVQEQLHNLLEDLKSWNGAGMDLVEQAARLHHRSVQIHPFPNGNGRRGRMLTNIWLTMNARLYVNWPESTIGEVSTLRQSYIKALKLADSGDLDPFIEMHRQHLATT